jgi:hypothetical protein
MRTHSTRFYPISDEGREGREIEKSREVAGGYSWKA